MDYGKLAQQFGGSLVDSEPTGGAVDYSKLANSFGGTLVEDTLVKKSFAQDASEVTDPEAAMIQGAEGDITPAQTPEQAALEARVAEYKKQTPLTERLKGSLTRGFEQAKGIIPGIEVVNIQKEIDKIKSGEISGETDPITGEFTPYTEEQKADMIARLQGQQQKALGYVMERQAEAGKIPRSPAEEAVAGAKTFGEAWQAFTVDPLGVSMGVSLESAPQMVPALIIAAVSKNPLVGMTAMGGTSYMGELSSGIYDYFRDNGVDTNDAKAVNAALQNPEMFRKAYEYAATRATIIGGADAVSAGLASKLLVPKKLITSNLGREAVNIALAQPAAQMVSGAGGEAAAQLATKGKIDQWGQVLLEAVGEGPTSILETASMGGRRALDAIRGTPEPEAAPVAQAAVPQERIEPTLGPRPEAAPEAAVAPEEAAAPAVEEAPVVAEEAPVAAREEIPAEVIAETTPIVEAPPAEVVLYRGVPAGRKGEETVGDAFFMSPDRTVAETYAGKKGEVTESTVQFNNLLEANTWVEAKQKLGVPRATMEGLVNAAREQGYDGVTFFTSDGKGKGGKQQEYIVIPQAEMAGVPAPESEEAATAKEARTKIQDQIARIKRAPGNSLYSELRGKVDISDVKDVGEDSTFTFLKSAKGRPIADIVADGTLDYWLPFEMRSDAVGFDEQQSTEYIKDKLRNQNYLPYESEMEVQRLGEDFTRADAAYFEILEIEDVNKELNAIADEEARLLEQDQAAPSVREEGLPPVAERQVPEQAKPAAQPLEAQPKEVSVKVAPPTKEEKAAINRQRQAEQRKKAQEKKEAPKVEAPAATPLEKEKGKQPPVLKAPPGLELKSRRNEQVVLAAEKLANKEITQEEYDRYVDYYMPIFTVDNPETPLTTEQIKTVLTSKQIPHVNKKIEPGTPVGLRMDIKALLQSKKIGRSGSVVAIHPENAPSKTLSFASAAHIKNVKFKIRSQMRSFKIARNLEDKTPQQTAEGEWVGGSPEEIYAQIQSLLKDPNWVQVSLDPLRHSFFYDRANRQPVVAADEVLQVGRFVLAKNPKYAERSKFLYNIEPSDMDPQVIDHLDEIARDEKIAEYAGVRRRMAAMLSKVADGGATLSTQRELVRLRKISDALKTDIDISRPTRDSAKDFLEKALRENNRGNLSDEVYDAIRWMSDKTPGLLDGMRLSVRQNKDSRSEAAGAFSPAARVLVLYKGTYGSYNPSTIRHEVTHSMEQMMSPEARTALIEAWQKDFQKELQSNKDKKVQEYLDAVLTFLAKPTKENQETAVSKLPDYKYYQLFSPSEYWAVNAEKLMKAKMGGAWERFTTSIKKFIQYMKNLFGFDNSYVFHQVFDDIMRGDMTRANKMSLTDFLADSQIKDLSLQNVTPPTQSRPNARVNIFGKPVDSTWGAPDETKMDSVIFTLQDKLIDTKRVQQEIEKAGNQIDERWDAYLQEELYHGRTAKQTKDFLKYELHPLLVAANRFGIDIQELETYLHNRHAEERNEQVAKINPNMPDGGSGINTEDAREYLDNLPDAKRKQLEELAEMVDNISSQTREILIESGQESPGVIDAWEKTYKHYVPLQREEADYDLVKTGSGVGQGFSVRGNFNRRALGSDRAVVDILANLAMQRERAIVRAEKGRVGQALYGLAIQNPNPDFWLAVDPDATRSKKKVVDQLVAFGLSREDANGLMAEPKESKLTKDAEDPSKSTVKAMVSRFLRQSDNVLAVRIEGKDKYLFFNNKDPRATRMVKALKNLDADQLSRAISMIGRVTRYFAAINTQYNPIFGVINFYRDAQGALLNLTTTPLAGKQAAIMANTLPALRGIYSEMRAVRADKPGPNTEWANLWEQFQQEGGQTGFKDMFSRSQERAEAIEREFKKLSDGTLKSAGKAIFGWLSDYNETMENAIRLATYKVGLDQGLSPARAASVAKNITVNFNRKGSIGSQAGALYAFFNAGVQGTERMYKTLSGPMGKRIVIGGLILGSAQALLLAAAGFDEDEPSEFIKEKNLIIPYGDGKYISLPLPLGFNVLPNTSRIITEWALSGFKKTPQRVISLLNSYLEAFNPLGNAGFSMQTFAPTVADPFVALFENKDWTGKPIAKKDISSLDPTPGYTRAKDTASWFSTKLAEFLNYASGGTKYRPGALSPTPDQIDYLIGQATGGVGREIMKLEQTIRSAITGETLPTYKIPLVGRFVGETRDETAQVSRYYNNIKLLNEHENEIKGRIKNRENVQEYMAENPEARLYRVAGKIEQAISKLRQRKEYLKSKNAPKEQIQEVNGRIVRLMTRLNESVKRAQEGEKASPSEE